MASKPRGAAKLAKPEKDVGPPPAYIKSVKEATGASEEDVKQMLFDCNNDANEATNRLLDGGAFAAVVNKKQRRKQKDEEKKKEVPAKVLEVRRQPSGAAQARDRARGNRGGDRNSGRGGAPTATRPKGDGPLSVDTGVSAPASVPVQSAGGDWDETPSTTERPAFARAPGQAAVSVPAPVAAVPSAPVAPAPAGWGTGAQGTISLAERLRRQNAAESAQARPEGPPAPGFPAQQQQQPPPPPPAQQQRQAVPTAPNGHTQAPPPPISVAPGPSRVVGTPVSVPAAAASAGDWGDMTPASVSSTAASHMSQGLQAVGTAALGGVAVQPPARQVSASSSFQNDMPASSMVATPANAWQPKPAGHAAGGAIGNSFAGSLAPGPLPVTSSAPGLPSPLMASDPAILSHAAPTTGGISQQFGAVGGAAVGPSQTESKLPAAPAPPQAAQQDPETVRLQFGNFGMGASNFAGGFGGSYSETPSFAEASAGFSDASPSFRDPSVLSGEQQQQQASQGSIGTLISDQAAGQQLQAPSSAFKSGVAPGPPSRQSGEFQRQSGEFQRQSGEFQRQSSEFQPQSQRAGSIGPPGSASNGAVYSTFAQQQKPQELAPGQGQYSQYNSGYGQQFGGAVFGQAAQYSAYGGGGSGGNPQQQQQQQQQMGQYNNFAQQQPPQQPPPQQQQQQQPQQPQQGPAPGYGQLGGAAGGTKPQGASEYGAPSSGGAASKFGPQGVAPADGQAPPPAASGAGPATGHTALHQPPQLQQQQQQQQQQAHSHVQQGGQAQQGGFSSQQMAPGMGGYGYGYNVPYGGYNMPSAPFYQMHPGYAGYPQYSTQAPVGAGFQQAPAYGNQQQHAAVPAGKYGAPTYGDGGYSSKDSKDSGAMYGAVTGSGQQHMMHAQQQQAPQQQQQQQQQLPRDAYPAYGAMPQQGAAAGFGGQQYGGQYGYQQYGQGHGGSHVGNGPAGTFKMQ